MSRANLGPGDFWHQEPEWQGERQPQRPAAKREPEELGLYTGSCLRWNPETKCAEPGTFTVHRADFIGGDA